MKSPRIFPLFALCLVVTGCAGESRVERIDREHREDDAELAKLESLRVSAANSKGAPRETIRYADEVISVLAGDSRKAVKRGAFLHVPYAHKLLDVAIEAAPDDAPTLLVTEGYLYEVTGAPTEAMAAYEKSFAVHPRLANVVMLTSRYDLQGRWRDVPGLCTKARPAIDSTELFAMLDACLYHSHSTTIVTGLAWASDDDRAMYVAELKRQEADAERRRAQREAREIAILQARITANAINQSAATTAAATREAAETTAAATRAAAHKDCVTTAVAGQVHTVCD
jgi:hypothetical protein